MEINQILFPVSIFWSIIFASCTQSEVQSITINKQIFIQTYNNFILIMPNSLTTILFIMALTLILGTHSEDQGDWVDPYLLPIQGVVHPFYAGYLDIEYNKQYYYVYHPSQSNPSKDPLMVRISAGPGCSSLYSWLYSKGPFTFTPGTPNFRINPDNWNKEANVLFIEGPVGVGFARNIQPVNQTQNMDDHTFAWQNIKAIFAFYDKFPELKDQELYLSGQQYAGVTVPLMAQMIIQHNLDPYNPSWTKLNLKGFLVENPCTLPDECDSHFEFTPYTLQYLHHHYYLSTEKFEEYRSKCSMNKTSEACQNVIYQIQHDFVTTNTDINNIYKECIKQTGPQKYKCVDMIGILAFLNHDTYKDDLHADPTINWDMCNLDIMTNFHRNAEGSFPIYEKLLTEERNLRIWVVSGSLSASVPLLGTRRWMEQLKEKLNIPTLRMWESWQYDEDINAGQVQQFRGITFASVRSAGASIYLDQPEIGYHLIDSFLKGKSL